MSVDKSVRGKMIITEEAYEYIFKYNNLPQFIQEVDNWIYAVFGSEYKSIVKVSHGEEDDSYLCMIIRIPIYDSVMNRIKEIREMYYPILNKVDWWFLLTTDYGDINQRFEADSYPKGLKTIKDNKVERRN
jgi:urate oxidase